MTDHRSNAATSADDAFLVALVGALQLNADQHGKFAQIMSHLSAGNTAGRAPVHLSPPAVPAAQVNTESVERFWGSPLVEPAPCISLRCSATPPDLSPWIPDPAAVPAPVFSVPLPLPPTPVPISTTSAPMGPSGEIPFRPLPTNAIVVPQDYNYHVPNPTQRGPYYLVTCGLDVGIYAGWEPTAALVIGVSHSIYCRVPSIQGGIPALNCHRTKQLMEGRETCKERPAPQLPSTKYLQEKYFRIKDLVYATGLVLMYFLKSNSILFVAGLHTVKTCPELLGRRIVPLHFSCVTGLYINQSFQPGYTTPNDNVPFPNAPLVSRSLPHTTNSTILHPLQSPWIQHRLKIQAGIDPYLLNPRTAMLQRTLCIHPVMPPLRKIKKLDLFAVNQRFVLRRNCGIYMALKVRAGSGSIEYDEWVREFMHGWHQKWLVYWEDTRVDQERIIMGLRWTFYHLHPNLHLHEMEVVGPISTDIVWSIPVSCRPPPKPKPIYVNIPCGILDGKQETSADVVGRVITRCIGKKQAAASNGIVSTM
ncbi:hypothetical protein EDD18DRAFT_1105614 [Armillaria luteobubalina]|uniref:Uncharacterized protein n=1 Tax=Armillaria luteobubalina TaxID=153913 RepID=A0AA39Q5P8_9AGAR|nr:hypothetical protein EDD18DRAFT_1105614 [Armillaria luteobubalina]